jgi:hypothetical protein
MGNVNRDMEIPRISNKVMLEIKISTQMKDAFCGMIGRQT